MHLPNLDVVKGISFNAFDAIVLVWLIVGLFRGRKHGMSEEFMLVFEWLLIVVGCGYAYRPAGDFIHQNIYSITPLWSYLISYVLIAFLIAAVSKKIKHGMGDKPISSDVFGRGEYYLGMMAGVLRYACMAFVLLALFNARIITKAELDETAKMQKKAFEDIKFPTYGSLQQGVLFQSFTGQMARKHMSTLLIESVPPTAPGKPRETMFSKERSALDEIYNPTKK